MNKRDSSLDLIRIYALISVIGIHFFLYTGFYSTEIIGGKMYLSVFIRTIFSTCVPLFIILTGYLMKFKKLSKNYYKSILRTLIVYFSMSIIIYAGQSFSGSLKPNLYNFFLKVLSFEAAGYSWYVEMYIGLFLIIPFLNIIYLNLTKNGKKILILTCLIMTAFPVLLNNFNLTEVSWWLNPRMNSNYNKIIPDFWIGMYPVTYYFLGCYIHEICNTKWFKDLEVWKIGMCYFFSVAIMSMFTIFRSSSQSYMYSSYQDWGSILVVVQAVSVFLLLKKVNLENISNSKKRILKLFADATLGGYLISQVFDMFIYNLLVAKIGDFRQVLPYILLTVPIIFALSTLTSMVVNILIDAVYKQISLSA